MAKNVIYNGIEFKCIDRRAIYRCLAGQQRQHKGFVFCREDGIINN